MKIYKRPGPLYRNEYFVCQGQKRFPKKGEYYLSGAIPQVYLAPNDLNAEYFIVIPTTPPPKTIERDGLIYRLET
jgi:hypothetical protein